MIINLDSLFFFSHAHTQLPEDNKADDM